MSAIDIQREQLNTSIEERPAMQRKKAGRDSHKANHMARVRKSLATQMYKLKEARAADFTELVNVAVREFLEREGYWPPERDQTPVPEDVS